MRRFLFSAVLALSGACGGDDSNVTYPPFPTPTKGPDAGPKVTPDGSSPAAAPVINELYYGEAGAPDTRAAEFVEIYGDPNASYSAYSLVWVQSNTGGALGDVKAVVALGTTNADGIFSITAETAGITAGIDNSSQSWLLVQGNTAAVDDDLDTDNDGVLDVSPWTAVVDAVAIDDGGANDTFYVAVGGTTYGVVLDRTIDNVADADGGGVARIPDGTDTDSAADWKFIPPSGTAADATQANSTPGASNTTGT